MQKSPFRAKQSRIQHRFQIHLFRSTSFHRPTIPISLIAYPILLLEGTVVTKVFYLIKRKVPFANRIFAAETLKENANELFSINKFYEAIKNYECVKFI